MKKDVVGAKAGSVVCLVNRSGESNPLKDCCLVRCPIRAI